MPNPTAAVRRLLCTAILWLGLFGSQPGLAEDSAPKAFGTVWRIAGEVTAERGDGPGRPLREGDPVYVGERIRAAATAEAVLRTGDAGYVAVRPGAAFTAERFVAEGGRQDGFTVRLLTGALRLITGWIGKINRDDHRVVTPTATIGVRGTDHEPYVLTEELARRLGQNEGTYDKVNRGGTTLNAGGGAVDIDPGRVGFAKALPKAKTRALMTLTLPVLLDRVPEFYVPGRFDDELDRVSVIAQAEADRVLADVQRATKPAAPPQPPVAAAGSKDLPPADGSARPDDSCGSDRIARRFLGELDGAIKRRNSDAILSLFAQDVRVKVTVRKLDGTASTVELDRAAFARGVIEAVSELSAYEQRRPTISGRPVESGRCDRIEVSSVVIEAGKQQGRSYRFESLETFLIERRGKRWIAVKAETVQR